MSGTMILYNQKGKKLTEKYYHNKWAARLIVNTWQRIYQDQFKQFYYHYSPEIIEEETIQIKTA